MKKLFEGKQWLLKAENYHEILDNEPEAKRRYGKLRKKIIENNIGYCKIFSKYIEDENWILLQEFKILKEDKTN